ncbi:MAG: recombinase family protein, partial [Desulfocucumaceae bacterium]
TRKRVGNQYFSRPESEWIVVENAHEPIIDAETWRMAQEKYNSNRAQPHIKLDFSPCELAGLVVCAKCGHRLVRQYSIQKYLKKNGEKSTYHKEFLWCPTPGCTCVKYRDVESSIIGYLKNIGEFNKAKLKGLFEAAYNSQKEIAVAADTSGIIEKRKAELKRRLRFICDKYEAGVYDDQMFQERKNEIEKELALLEPIASIDPAKQPAIEHELVKLKENIKTFLEAYLEADNKTLKNKLLSELLSAVYLNKTGKGRFDLEIHPRFNFYYSGQ